MDGVQVISKEIPNTIHLIGCVNGHDFELEGKGIGHPYEGEYYLKIKVTKGAPLPFDYHILLPALEYGNRAFTKYPPTGLADFFKQSFPEGFKFGRKMEFEDGATCTVSSNITLNTSEFNCEIRFFGTGFPENGPVMKKQLCDWVPSYEKMVPCGQVLKGTVDQALNLKDGGYHCVSFTTIYEAKKRVQMPYCHYVEHRLQVLKVDKWANQWIQHELAQAVYPDFPTKPNLPIPGLE